MLGHIEEMVGGLRAALTGFEPGRLSGIDASRLVELFAEGEAMCAAGKALAARRVEETNAWRREGHRSAAHWMAVHTGESVGQAVTALETAHQLEQLPTTQKAFISGELSESQTRAIAAAAVTAPAAEADLLQAAATQTVTGLRQQCRRVRAAATAAEDERARYERIRHGRYLRHWTDPDGAFRLDGRLTPDDGARLLAALDVRRQRIFRQERAAGRRESLGAYLADALVDLATGAGGPAATIQVRVDHTAWVRGSTETGEVCEIPGVGPVPVEVARRLAEDSILKAVITDGTDIAAVTHLGRNVTARQRTALEARDPTCVVPGCDTRFGLEIDHTVPWNDVHRTELSNLAHLCHFHHVQKTHHGATLNGGPGHWTWTPPPPPAPEEGQLPLPP
ncbi:MAG: DUF222 domain-containing protein [Acidimicrobiia bacterium]